MVFVVNTVVGLGVLEILCVLAYYIFYKYQFLKKVKQRKSILKSPAKPSPRFTKKAVSFEPATTGNFVDSQVKL